MSTHNLTAELQRASPASNAVASGSHSLTAKLVRPSPLSNAESVTISAAAPISEDFTAQYGSNHISPDGLFRIAGPWTGTGGNELLPALATISPAPTGPADPEGNSGGYLNLSVAPNVLQGSEIQSLPGTTSMPALGPGYGYGYYETRMRVTPVSGTVASFFWVEAPNYGPHEWDIEFLTNESPRTRVHYTLHPSGDTFIYNLGFDWSADFHRYGFLWVPGTITFTVDGVAVHTFANDTELAAGSKGFIMANAWTGDPNWGGGPPTQQSYSSYNYLRHWPGATSIP